jgi:hypothetical protein
LCKAVAPTWHELNAKLFPAALNCRNEGGQQSNGYRWMPCVVVSGLVQQNVLLQGCLMAGI